jgi:hypothetical protein
MLFLAKSDVYERSIFSFKVYPFINLQQVQNKYMHIFNHVKLMIKPEYFQIVK